MVTNPNLIADMCESLRPVLRSMFDWGVTYKQQSGEEVGGPLLDTLRDALSENV